MAHVNYYPIKFKDFLRIKSIGTYTIMYAILKDRVHFEMAIENAVFATQKFLIDIEEELKEKAQNYHNDKVQIFLKMVLGGTTFYRYYPTKQMEEDIIRIKLYDRIVIKEAKNGEYDKDALKIFESDTFMKAMDGDDVILFGVKE